MNKVLSAWEARCASSRALRFVDVNLRGVAQVMFQDNPLTGAVFLAAIAWGSFAAGVPEVLAGAVAAVVVATLTAMWLDVDEAGLRAGLYGYNGVLVGMALATFIAPGPMLWAYVVLGAAVSVVVTLATAGMMKPWGMAALTFPFVITAWLLLLATYGFWGLAGHALPAGAVVTPFEPAAAMDVGLSDFALGVLRSIAQVFLKGSGVAGVVVLVGLAVSSPVAAAYALGGAILAVVTAHLFGAESDLVVGGLLGFSPVLTAVALGAVFHRPGWRTAAYAALGTVFTVFAQAAFNVALTPLAIPALTAPFVLVSWLFLLPKQRFDDAAGGREPDPGDVGR